VVLRMLDTEKGVFATSQWPEAWKPIKDRIEARISPERWKERTPPPPPFEAGPAAGGDGALIEIPVFGMPRGGGPRGPFGRGEFGWAIIELNLQYVREVVFPEVLQSHLGTGGTDYQVEVVTRTNPPAVIYQSDPDGAANLAQTADASVGLFEPHYEQIFWRWRGRGMRDRDREPERMEPPRGPSPGPGRWEMYVRHRAGSLEAVVSRARWRNLAVTAGVLLLMLASIAALVRYTRQAQKLAELQMEFVAGVSHELRTPLTVIHTAAYNLRGKLANNPAQVERYGSLIQQESGRLKELVEQTLRFAGTQAGHAINKPEPVCVESVVQAAVESSQSLIRRAGCAVEKSIAPGLPLVLGDPMALKHAFENLISNAVKYGTEGSNWIGISVLKAPLKDGEAVEVRVADHGPGIPEDEQEQVFDPFFRGRRALQEQVHGTGLGLNLVRKIVEAHGGKIRVNSQPMKGAEFIVRLPAAPPEQVDEFADSAGRG
jgi:signal transduction histidine kinase